MSLELLLCKEIENLLEGNLAILSGLRLATTELVTNEK